LSASGQTAFRAYLQDTGDRLVLRPSREDALARGALWAFVLAPLLVGLGTAIALYFGADDGLAFFLTWIFSAIAGSICAIFGFVTMARAESATARAVKIDLAERLLERPSGPPEVLRGIEKVRVRSGRMPWSGWTLDLVFEDRAPMHLLEAPRTQGRALSDAAEHLADALGARAEIPSEARRARSLAHDPRIAAALCYLPIEGVNLVASIWFLMSSSDPFVRFSAKQSLLQLASMSAASLFVAGCCGLPFTFVLPPAASWLPIAISLFAWIAVDVLVRMIASARAHRGVVWIFPWLAPISRRWAPPPAPKPE
jgi:uncharacterized membrane protein